MKVKLRWGEVSDSCTCLGCESLVPLASSSVPLVQVTTRVLLPPEASGRALQHKSQGRSFNECSKKKKKNLEIQMPHSTLVMLI